ncbi:MAG: hypothetical protein KatS3mg016_1926 [Fimbriimonadales bacterium]|nr:MAG: hypothetical protein KatS3mg016_1926 [Fimbriimonadales bacterium]
MKPTQRLTMAVVGIAATLWLSGCGGGSSTASEPGTPNNPANPNNPSLPSTNRIRLFQHGDEFTYTISGVALYLGQRFDVSGTSTDRITSAGAGVLRVKRETRLHLRRGSQTYSDNSQAIYYISQDRQSREVTLIGYAIDEDDPITNSTLPYRVVVPGIIHENSNFSYSVEFEDGRILSETWQIGTIEPVSTYAGQYPCYRMRFDGYRYYPAPFREAQEAGTCWFSPQLGTMTRIESNEQGWLDGEPVEYRLTYILQRTNVSPNSP